MKAGKNKLFCKVRHQNSGSGLSAFQKVAPSYHAITDLCSQHTALASYIIFRVSCWL